MLILSDKSAMTIPATCRGKGDSGPQVTLYIKLILEVTYDEIPCSRPRREPLPCS